MPPTKSHHFPTREPAGVNVEVFPDSEALAEHAVDEIVAAAARAIDERGVFVWAVSGGSTPRRLLELLGTRTDIDWTRTHLFQVDERIAPAGDPARNSTMLAEALLSEDFHALNPHVHVWLMPVSGVDAVVGAAEYAETMNEISGSPVVFDLIQLGLGEDGHTASLVPGDPILDVVDRDVAITAEYRGHRRMSLTWPVLDRAKQQLWVVSGAAKKAALRQYLDNDRSIPATLPTQSSATVLVDQAAWSGHET